MDTNLLRTWLGLPPGPWPPEDRELLGLGPQSASPADVEQRALEQMEKLRPHQLVQPDLVTEGMNRLAQAMIALTTPAAGPGTLPPPPEPAPPPKRPRRLARPAKPLPRAPLADRPPRRPVAPPAVDAEPVLDAEPLAAEPPPVEPARPQEPGLFVPPDDYSHEPPIADELPSIVGPARATPPELVVVPKDRRRAYGRLVRLRKLLRLMDEMRPFFADPGEQLLTPLRVFEFVRAVREFRREVVHGRGARWPVRRGRAVLAIAGHPLALSLFRTLVPSQRQGLAADWAVARDELRHEYGALRRELQDTKPASNVTKQLRVAGTWLRDNPEWALVLSVSLAFVVAVVRVIARGAS